MTWKCLDCPLDESTNRNAEVDSGGGSRDTSRHGQRKVLADVGDTPSQLYTATLGDLTPDASYQVTLAAANSRGVGQEFIYPVVRTRHPSK